MRIRPLSALLAAILLAPPAGATEFTYRGRLSDGDRPAQGRYDLQVMVYSSEHGGAWLAQPITLLDVMVTDGRFVVPITLDDTSSVSGERWLELAVRESGSKAAFDVLPAREKALQATTATCTGAWDVTGNAGNPVGSFLGNTDAQSLELRVNNSRVARFGTNGSFTLGDSGNLATFQAAVSIGGIFGQPNSASNLASIAVGGALNTASGYVSSVCGGLENSALGVFSATLGGYLNTAGGDRSMALGTNAIVRDVVATGEPAACSGPSTCGDEGTFVWADSTLAPFVSTGPNQFLIRAAGGVGINTGSPPAGQVAIAGDVVLTRTVAREIYVGKEPDNSTPGKNLTISAGDASDSGVPFQARFGGDLILQAGNAFNVSVDGQDGGDVILRTGANWINATPARSGGDIVMQTGDALNAFNERLRIKDTGQVSVAVLGAAGAIALCMNATNEISTCSSSARYKEHIVDADFGLATIAALRPVRFEWKDTHAADLGLVAEEVAGVESALATRNAAGEVEGVKYDRLAAVLVKAMQEQQAQLQQQQEEIATLRFEQQRLVQMLQRGTAVRAIAALTPSFALQSIPATPGDAAGGNP
jgi:hypothetical protein